MNDFWKSYDITHAEFGADYRCYPLYGGIHLTELALSLAFIAGMAWWYRRSSARTRRRILIGVTLLLVLDEADVYKRQAIALGQGNKEDAEKIIGNSFTMLLFFAVVLTLSLIHI